MAESGSSQQVHFSLWTEANILAFKSQVPLNSVCQR